MKNFCRLGEYNVEGPLLLKIHTYIGNVWVRLPKDPAKGFQEGPKGC